jgi:hypothetical protein
MRSIKIGGDEMTIKIEVFTNSGMYEIEEEIHGFPNAQAAADYRDHDARICYKFTKLAQDEGQPVCYGPMNAMEADGAEGTGAGQAQVIEYYPDWVSTLKNFSFYATLAFLMLWALGSLVMLLTLGAGW